MIDISDNEVIVKIKKTGLLRAVLVISLITSLLSFTDILIGSELSFSIFYLFPITIAVFLSGKELGIVFSIICSVVWILSDIVSGSHYSNIYIPVWNTIVRMGYFLIHTIIISKLLSVISEIKEVGFRDPLTKVYNWRYFEEYTNGLIKTSSRKRSSLALTYFDIDNFKQLNDTFGHSIGDQALIVLTEIVRNEVRSGDIIARLGGDEFALVMNEINKEASTEIMERIRNKVNREMELRKWPISLSIGCIIFTVMSSTIGPMLKQVDDLMYTVKKNGKNNVKIINQYEEQA